MGLITETNRRWWALGTLSFSLFMIVLDNSVVSLALPSIQGDLKTSLSQLEWIVNAYALVFAVLLLTAGKLADFLGRRLIFLAGLVVFTASSLACGLAPSGGALIGARAVQGTGAAMMLPATLSIITAIFPVRERGTAIGIWAGVSGAGLAIGPLVGGIILRVASWPWIFYINVPVGIAGLLATLTLVPESRDTSAEQRLDVPGLLASAIAMFAVNFGLIEANNYGWTSATILLCFIGAGLALVVFVLVETRQRRPMLDLSLFRNPTFAGANAGGMLLFVSVFGYVIFLSIFLQSVLGYSVLQAGGTFLVTTLAIMAMAPISGKVSDRFGGRWIVTGGMALWGGSMLVLSTIVDVDTGFWQMAPWLLIAGIGFGWVMAPMTAAVLATVGVDSAGVASGVMQAFRQLGAALGVSVMGAVVASKIGDLTPRDPAFRAEYADGFQNVLVLVGAVALAAALTAVLTIRSHVGIEARHHAEAPT
jgi:EmrB/QacA subfamily drug resistance transporter